MQDFFTKQQWQWIQNEYEDWWTGKREKPIINLRFTGEMPHMKRPEGLITEATYKYAADEPAERIAQKAEYIMRSKRYAFHGYPDVAVYFGPVYRVEYLGCRPHITNGTVWFEPEKKLPADQLHIQRDPHSIFLPRVKEIYKAVNERFQEGYVIGGGGAAGGGFGVGQALDMVAEFFGPEELSYLLYDEPEEVKRLMREVADALKEIGDEINTLATNAIGYTAYSNLYAPVPWVVAQCDFCAMISPAHFDEFVLPDLAESFRASPRYNFYHLDGPGEIIHMDKILAQPDLKCMQWVPGPKAEESVTLEVYERIHKAGKNLWVQGPIERALAVAERNGTARGIYWTGEYPMEEYDRIMKLAEQLMNGR